MKIVCTKAEALKLARLCEKASEEDCCRGCILSDFCSEANSMDEVGLDAMILIDNNQR